MPLSFGRDAKSYVLDLSSMSFKSSPGGSLNTIARNILAQGEAVQAILEACYHVFPC